MEKADRSGDNTPKESNYVKKSVVCFNEDFKGPLTVKDLKSESEEKRKEIFLRKKEGMGR